MDNRSTEKLKTCTKAIQAVFNEVDRRGVFDFKVSEGHRTQARQNELYDKGRSKVRIGKHNSMPSEAVDIIPLQPKGKIDWNDRELFTFFAGYVLGVADSMGISLRWGGDWDNDKDLKDNKFDDLVHFEEKEF